MKKQILKIITATVIAMTLIHEGAYSYVALSNSIKAEFQAFKIQIIADAAASIGYELPKEPPIQLSIRDIVEREALTYGINPQLAFALIQVESGWRPYVVSPKGAMGLMQIMPATAKSCGLEGAEGFEPIKNISCGMKRLHQALVANNWDSYRACEDYNGGSNCVGGKCTESRKHAQLVHQIIAKDIS